MKLNKNNALYQEDINNVLSSINVAAFQNKSFLITGATGLIGTFMIDVLMHIPGVKVFALGRSKAKAAARIGEYFENPNFEFVEQDVQQPLPNVKVDFIIPAASNTHPLAYSQFPVETIMVNIKGAEHALNLARQTGAVVLYPSSVEIYGNATGQDDFDEDYTGKLNLSTARSCYTESKRVSESMCLSYMAQHGVQVKIARLSRIFGPTMLESDSKASSQFIKNAIDNTDIVLKSEGLQFFSYTYVADAVAAMLYVLDKGEAGAAYNISNAMCDVHLKDFAGLCAEYNGKKVIFDLPSESERKGFSIASKAILSNKKLLALGFEPRYDIKKAIFNTISILKE